MAMCDQPRQTSEALVASERPHDDCHEACHLMDAPSRRAQVSTRHCFGIKADVKDNVYYLDEQTVLYPAGHNIVIFNAEQKIQKFIPGTDNTEGITAIAVSPNHKYVAVAEQAKEGEKAMVTVFDLHTLKRRKVHCTYRQRSPSSAYRSPQPQHHS